MKRNIVPDDAAVSVPCLDYKARHVLNRLTAYGRPMIEGSSLRCGCFHCGSTFAASEITDWMPEEDGADTALCPYCGCDTVLYDTEELPVSTALLSSMYTDWFGSEYRERKKAATYVPPFSGYDDYQRRGIVFLLEESPLYQQVGEVELWRFGGVDEWDWPEDDGRSAGDPDDAPDEDARAEEEDGSKGEPEEDKEAGGLMRIVIHGEGSASPGYEFVDERGHALPYPLWGQRDRRLLRELLDTYGSRLMGLLVEPYDSKLRLVIKLDDPDWIGEDYPE